MAEQPEIPGDYILEVSGLNISFDRTPIHSALDFSVARGACLAVIGPNGSGKTVLFRALIGAIPFGGTIRWAPGTRFGYVPQKLDIERDLPRTRRGRTRSARCAAWNCVRKFWRRRSEACPAASFSACWSRSR
jgi:ABC-type Mn2+/Zn2+ transport system ATPase subunit